MRLIKTHLEKYDLLINPNHIVYIEYLPGFNLESGESKLKVYTVNKERTIHLYGEEADLVYANIRSATEVV